MLPNNGRHRAAKSRHSRTQRLIASAGLAGVGLAVPLVSATSASAASVSTWDRVASCESTNNWSIDTGNGYYGGLQFSASTWAAYGGTQYAATANQATKGQQIAVAEKVLASQGPGAWPVCGPQAGLTAGGAPAQVSTSSSAASTTSAPTTSTTHSTSSASRSTASTGSTASGSTQFSDPVYTVGAGDWLSTIAIKEHVSGGWQRLYELNRATLTEGPDMIYPGETLKLSGTASSSSNTGSSSDNASDAAVSTTTTSSASRSSAVSGSMASAISFAESQVGKAYVYGGTGPSTWDCSGLAQATLAKAGISAPRTSEEQAAASTRVSLSNLQPGDLLFWSSDGSAAGAYHVAVYTGNGAYVEAANPSSGVKTDTIANWGPTFAGRIG